MRVPLAGLMIAVLAPCGLQAGGAEPAEECAVYLDVRERLAPVEVLSHRGLSLALGRAGAQSIELVGDISGMASSAAGVSGGLPRTLMMTLDDGSNVALHANDDVDRLRVGDRVAVIAAVARGATSSRRLVVEAWVLEWDLPPREEAAGGEPDAGQEEQSGVPSEAEHFPQAAAAPICRLDAIEVWKAWALEHNSKLTDEQAANIVKWVLQYAQQYDVNHKLIFAVIKWESWFDPNCRSHAGAIGLMQLMPGTARYLGVNAWNVQQNIDGGVHYLAEQLATYRDRPPRERVILALACYNAGPNAVARAGHRVPNITETQRYVRKVSDTFYELHQARMP